MSQLPFPIPENESQRLNALRKYQIMDTLPEQAYDDLTKLASIICSTPIALITLLDEHRQWFKSKIGLETNETPRAQAFCAYAIMNPGEVMIVKDATSDERFVNNPLVTFDPNIRFYVGVPLVTPSGEALGTICVIDNKSREITQDQIEALKVLSREVVVQLELRRSIATLEKSVFEQDKYVEQLQEYQRDLEKAGSEFKTQSLTDALTGINNRRAFEEEFEEEFLRAIRYKVDCSLLMIDVDHFKEFNDTFGHPAGDEVLRAVAALLKLDMRIHDFLARYGGEEFVVILPNTNLQGGKVMGERFRRTIQRASWTHRAITISVGVASITDEIQTSAELLKKSDHALYHAKENGRNRVSSSSDGLEMP